MLHFRLITAAFIILQAILYSRAHTAVAQVLSTPLLEKGLVVESLSRNTRAEKVGVRPGDILLAWKRGDAGGEFNSPFDLTHVFLEQADRGPITIKATRNGRPLVWIFYSDTWGIMVRPNFKGPMLVAYQEAAELAAAGKFNDASDHYKAAATIDPSAIDLPTLLWLFAHGGRVLSNARQWDLSEALYREAIDRSDDAGPMVKGELWLQLAGVSEHRNDLDKATECYRQVLLEWQKIGPKTMAESNVLLGLGVVELNRGDLDSAQEHLSHAMAIERQYAPNGIHALLTLANLAVLYERQGRFDKAEEYYLRAIDSEEKHFPGTAHLARTLTDLGVLLDQEGDSARAEFYERRALVIAERLGPESSDVADILAILADCVLKKGNALKAQAYQERALAIREKIDPGGLTSARSLAGLGSIALRRNNLRRAEEYYRESVAIAEKLDAPSHDREAFITGLAAVLLRQGDLLGAERFYRQGLEIIQKNDPGNIDRTDVLADLAGTLYRQDRKDEAVLFYQEALQALENQSRHLGQIEETSSRYRAERTRYYREYATLLLKQGQLEQGFEVLEGARARTLLEMLTRAHVDVLRGQNPTQRQRERKLRWLLNAKSEYRIRLSSGVHTEQQLLSLDAEIDDLLLQYQQVVAELRASSSAYAALTETQRITVSQMQQLLDTNTMVLEYTLGEDSSHIWVMTKTSIVAYDLPKREDVERAAHRVYELLTLRNQVDGKPDTDNADKECERAARRLSGIILGPVARLLKRRRLVIVADGALQYIPFSALPDPSLLKNPVPLVVNHEIVTLPSLSVLAEIRHQALKHPKPSGGVAVFADPVFDSKDERVVLKKPSSSMGPHLPPSELIRSTTDLGLNSRLPRLIYTREEADAVVRAISTGKRLKATDFKANRALATSSLLANYRIVHFATHGFLNNKHPELSGLVLTLVDDRGKPQDGFLKLQDIYNLKLAADLVVLSGCSTGLGEEINGEGLISLTRGFMYAGANRVIASLWNVNDRGTAALMAELYKAMEGNGMRPAAALRAAQIQMWKDAHWHSPYYWASFEIQGDWR